MIYFLNQQSKHTIITSETTNDIGEPYYPVFNKRNIDYFNLFLHNLENDEKEPNYIRFRVEVLGRYFPSTPKIAEYNFSAKCELSSSTIEILKTKITNHYPKDWIKVIKSSRYGVLMTDNDYEDGILRTIAHKISEKTEKRVHVMGLKNKSAGHTETKDNLPPNCFEIVKKVKKIIK